MYTYGELYELLHPEDNFSALNLLLVGQWYAIPILSLFVKHFYKKEKYNIQSFNRLNMI